MAYGLVRQKPRYGIHNEHHVKHLNPNERGVVRGAKDGLAACNRAFSPSISLLQAPFSRYATCAVAIDS